MKKLIILAGVPGSGKSTYIKKNLPKNSLVLSSDEIRLELFGEMNQENNDKVFALLHDRLEEGLKDETVQTIVYDATNVTRKRRKSIYNQYKGKANIEVHMILVPLKTAQKQNKEREHKVPNYVIERMYMQLEPPRKGVDCDNYKIIGNYDDFLEEIEEHMDEPHYSPWHTETIREHIQATVELSPKDYLKEIAEHHDLGKSVTRKDHRLNTDFSVYFKEQTGHYKTYYAHERVSAMYYVLKNKDTITENIYQQNILEVILFHIMYKQGISEKQMKNNNLTEEILQMLKEFEDIDGMAKTEHPLLKEKEAFQKGA